MLLCTLMLLALNAGRATAGLEPASSAEVCGGCHRSIHEAWKTSAHSQAMESRLFQDVLELAEADFGGAARKVCLECHSPVGARTNDLALVRKVSWEGVTCDFCHSITDVSTAGANPKASVAFTLTKTGPLKDSESTGHATAYSAVHTSSAICAPCHEYRNSGGFPVLTTYSEFRNSIYAKQGKECQSCHMSRVAGDVVDPKIKRSSVARINLHQMPGSHSLEQLTSAVKAQMNAVREGDMLKVMVDVTNQTAGHYLPTGSPLRQLVLEVRADSYGGQHFREERVYMRKVADQHGTVLMREHFAFLKGAQVVSDTRLAPGEKRTETFTFALPPGNQAQLKATFRYLYSPMARVESQKQITFLTLNRLVR
jgi:hypothetical protein